jgi:hypothetical protein
LPDILPFSLTLLTLCRFQFDNSPIFLSFYKSVYLRYDDLILHLPKVIFAHVITVGVSVNSV